MADEPAPLHIVSGKGGTGKTTISLALAMVLAGPGLRVLSCEVESRHGLTEIAGVPEIPPGQERVLFDVGRGRVSALSVDPHHALTDYLSDSFHLGLAGRILDKAGFVGFATDIAPGLRDVLLVGKVYQAARRRLKRSPNPMDAVVLDAVPTGRLHTFLTAGDALADVVKVGPLRQQADSMMSLLRSPTTRVHLVTAPTELAVTETLETMDALAPLGIGMGRLIVNQTLPVIPSGLPDGTDPRLVALLDQDRRLAADQRRWIDLLEQRRRRDELQPLIEVPALATEIGPSTLPILARHLALGWSTS